MRMTQKEYLAHQMKVNKKSKYMSQAIEFDGIRFDSKKEGLRYLQLKQMQRDGEISELQLQPKFLLQEGFIYRGSKKQPIHYISDFQYREGEEVIVEDVKSKITEKIAVYRIKRKMFMFRYPEYLFREKIM